MQQSALKMNRFDNLKTKFAKAFLFLSLLLSAALFVKKNWDAYQSKATSVIFSTENVDYFENPTIMFCFAPATKLSLLKQLNLTKFDFVISPNSNESLTFAETWADIYH